MRNKETIVKKLVSIAQTVLPALALTFGACGAPEEALDDEEQPVAALRSNLCTDGAADRALDWSSFDGCGGGASSAQPTSGYDRPACADMFTVEISGTQGRSFNPVASWGEPLPRDMIGCRGAVMEVEVAGRTAGGTWETVLSRRMIRGEWDAARGTCRMVRLPPIESSPHARIRIAIKAYLAYSFGAIFYKRAYGGVSTLC
jgi:hypothetical protein